MPEIGLKSHKDVPYRPEIGLIISSNDQNNTQKVPENAKIGQKTKVTGPKQKKSPRMPDMGSNRSEIGSIYGQISRKRPK